MMAEDIVIRSDLRIPGFELEETMSRSGGPGGQHANKTSTRVQLRWSVANTVGLHDHVKSVLLERLRTRLTQEGDLVVVVDAERSQHMNREIARERMAEIVRRALVPRRPRVATRPTKGSARRRVEGKKQRSVVKKSRERVDDEDD